MPFAFGSLGSGDIRPKRSWRLDPGGGQADGRFRCRFGRLVSPEYTKGKSCSKRSYLKEGTAIPEDAFLNAVQLKRVELPATLLQIGSRAFQGCESLESLELPAGLRQIDTRAFYGCSGLKEIFFGGRIQVIGQSILCPVYCLGRSGVCLGRKIQALRILEGAFRQCNALKRARADRRLDLYRASGLCRLRQFGGGRTGKGAKSYRRGSLFELYFSGRNPAASKSFQPGARRFQGLHRFTAVSVWQRITAAFPQWTEYCLTGIRRLWRHTPAAEAGFIRDRKACGPSFLKPLPAAVPWRR